MNIQKVAVRYVFARIICQRGRTGTAKQAWTLRVKSGVKRHFQSQIDLLFGTICELDNLRCFFDHKNV